jgi:hypothetical protein
VTRACRGTTKAGKGCKAHPLHGTDFCMAHADEETRASVGFGGPENGAKGGKAKRVPRLTEILRERVEAEADTLLGNLLELALRGERAVVVGNGPTAHVEIVDDPELRLKATREVYDRLEGRPRQVAEITGSDGGPVELAVPTDAESRSVAAARLLLKAHGQAVPVSDEVAEELASRNGHG